MIEYRAGDSPIFTKQKMPGMRKAGDVTLKKGVFKDDKAMWNWINGIKLNTNKRATVTVNLLDESVIMSCNRMDRIKKIKLGIMAVIIKEMHIRTVVEKRVVTEAELPEEIIRKIERRVLDRLSEEEGTGRSADQRRKRNGR